MGNNNISEIVSSLKTLIDTQQWQNALNLLNEHKDQFDSAIYHYNVAVVKVNLAQSSDAMYHFEMAKSLGLQSPELINSINSLKEQLNISYIENSLEFIDLMHQLLFQLPNQFYYSVSILMLILVFWNFKLIVTRLFKVLLILVSIAPSIFFTSYIKPKEMAIIQANLKVYAGPSRIFDQVQEIPEGAKIIIGNDYNNWKQVIYPQRFKGWIFSDKYKAIRN